MILPLFYLYFFFKGVNKLLKSEKKKLVNVLEEELSDLKVERENSEDSPYFIDYLYGISDVKEEVEKLLHTKRSNEWVLVYQILLKKDVLDSKEYYLYSLDPKLYFIMKNKEDLEVFKNFYMKERDTAILEYKDKIDEIYTKYSEQFDHANDQEQFKSLLENYFSNKDDSKESDEYIKATYELGNFIKSCNKRKTIRFKQADFFKVELGFKGTKEYPGVARKYERVMENER